MKSVLLLLAFATPVFAQVTPSTPTKFETKGAGASAGVGATASGTEKPKPLPPTDKKFIKDALDSMYYEMEAIGKAKTNATDPTKALSGTIKDDLDKIWADVAQVAGDRGENIPDKLSAGDKSKLERLGKAGDKFDKEYFKIINREAEKLAKTFETAQKSATEPAIKEIAPNWTAKLKDHVSKLNAAEKDAAKAK
jgi:predicted outer membrane protein